MFQAIVEIPEGSSLKDKRQAIKSVLERLRNSYRMTAAEVDLQNSLSFAQLGGAIVSNSRDFGEEVMRKAVDAIERDLACRLHSYQVHSETFD